MGFNLGHWLSNAVKSAGRTIGSGLKAVAKETGKIGDLIKKIPVVGGPLMGAIDLAAHAVAAPISIAVAMSKGQRIDKAVLGELKHDLADVKEVAPLARTIISFVPGIGTGINAAISGAMALASGQPIGEALLAAVKGALPGAPLSSSAFDVAAGIMQHKPLDQVALAALPIDDSAKNLLKMGLQASHAAANGQPIDPAIVAQATSLLPADAQAAIKSAQAAGGKDLATTIANSALKAANLPPDLNKAVQTGLATGHAQTLQSATKQVLSDPQSLAALAAEGQGIASRDAIVSAAASLVPVGQHGFYIGVAVSNRESGAEDIKTIRDALSPDDTKGFDMAFSLHIGRVTTHAPAELTDPKAQAGWYITHGMQGGDPNQKAALMQTVTSDQAAASGAKTAIVQVADNRKGWWTRFLEWLGIE